MAAHDNLSPEQFPGPNEFTRFGPGNFMESFFGGRQVSSPDTRLGSSPFRRNRAAERVRSKAARVVDIADRAEDRRRVRNYEYQDYALGRVR